MSEAKNFTGRLNLDSFSNIEKSYTSEEFSKAFPETEFKILEKDSVKSFIETIRKSAENLALTSKEEADKMIRKSLVQLNSLKPVHIFDAEDCERDIFVLSVTELKKAEKEQDDIEKGIVSEAFTYSNNIKMNKTGKELKLRINDAIKDLESEEKEISDQLDKLADGLVTQPAEKIDSWRMRDFGKGYVCPYKVFNWSQTYFYENTKATDGISDEVESTDSKKKIIKAPATKEEAADNSNWNKLVYQFVDICYEKKLLKLYQNNLDDKKSYEMTPQQLLALKF